LLDPNDPADANILREMIVQGTEMSRLIAAQRMLETKDNRLAESAVTRGLSSENESARAFALKIAVGYAPLRPELARHLSSPDKAVEIAALSAIAFLHQKERFTEVARYIDTRYREVSAVAARTLVELDPYAAGPALEEGLASKSSYVRIHSAAMLVAVARRVQPIQR
jgi:hypothetical protein